MSKLGKKPILIPKDTKVKIENGKLTLTGPKGSKELNIKNTKTSPDSDSQPIFIVGMPRSGTTLVEQILSSHPDVYGVGELRTLSLLVKKLFFSEDEFIFKEKIDSPIKGFKHYKSSIEFHCVTAFRISASNCISSFFRFRNF